jgi:hypothetical protein
MILFLNHQRKSLCVLDRRQGFGSCSGIRTHDRLRLPGHVCRFCWFENEKEMSEISSHTHTPCGFCLITKERACALHWRAKIWVMQWDSNPRSPWASSSFPCDRYWRKWQTRRIGAEEEWCAVGKAVNNGRRKCNNNLVDLVLVAHASECAQNKTKRSIDSDSDSDSFPSDREKKGRALFPSSVFTPNLDVFQKPDTLGGILTSFLSMYIDI